MELAKRMIIANRENASLNWILLIVMLFLTNTLSSLLRERILKTFQKVSSYAEIVARSVTTPKVKSIVGIKVRYEMKLWGEKM